MLPILLSYEFKVLCNIKAPIVFDERLAASSVQTSSCLPGLCLRLRAAEHSTTFSSAASAGLGLRKASQILSRQKKWAGRHDLADFHTHHVQEAIIRAGNAI